MSVRVYECLDCGSRVMAQGFPGRCKSCEGQLVNIAVRRE